MFDIFSAIVLPTEVLGFPFWAFVGVVVGTFLACYEGLRTKFRVVKLKVGNEDIVFDKRYLASAVVVVLVVLLTIVSVVEVGLSTHVPNTFSGFMMGIALGFVEGNTTLKTLNTRIDLFIKSASAKMGATEEEQRAIAEAIHVEDVTETTPKFEVKFERNLKNL